MAKFLPKYEEKFCEHAKDFGFDPEEEDYGSLVLLARSFFEFGLEAADVKVTRPEPPPQ